MNTVVDKSSASALINLRTRLNVPIVTAGQFSSFCHKTPGVDFQNNWKTEETREETHYSFKNQFSM